MAGFKINFDGPLNAKCLKQIEFRQKINSKSTKSVEELSLFNARGGWVKVTSGVNHIVGEDNKELANRIYGEDLEDSKKALIEHRSAGAKEASETVLAGGILREDLKDDDAPSKYRQGLNFLDDKSSSYSNSIRGFKAMPGITDFSIKSLSIRNGAMKQVEFKLKINTVEDLDIIDTLYFRPGFDILIEYGANVYIDADGEIGNQIYSVSKKFLKGENLPEIEDLSIKYKEKTGGNYEALVGKVANFSWDYNLDGSYDCSVKIITRGDLIESLEALEPATNPEIIKDAEENSNTGSTTKGSFDWNDAISVMLVCLMWGTKSARKRIKKKYKVDVFRSIELKSDKVQGQDNAENNSDKSKNYHWYITLRDFLHLLNEHFIPAGTKRDGKLFKLSTAYSENGFTTFHEHMSIDPGICFLPYTGAGKAWYFDSDTWFWRNSFFDNYKDPTSGGHAGGLPPKVFVEGHKEQKQRFGEDYNPRSPQAICLNINHLLEIQNSLLEEAKKSSKTKISVYNLLKQILDDCETVMGGINDLEIVYDSDSNEWSVRDIGIPKKVTRKTVPKLKITGTNSFVTNLSMRSKINSLINNALAISASATNGADSDSNLLQFNKNLYNRYTTINPNRTEVTRANEGNYLEKIIGQIGGAFASYTQGHYDRSKFTDNNSNYYRYCKVRLATEQDKQRRQFREVGFPGIIPIELSLTLDGMTNFVPSETFQIGKGVLPERYNDQVCFKITQIEQKISNDNIWSTELTAQMVMLATNSPIYPKPVREERPAPDTSKVSYRPKEKTNRGSITPTNTPWSAAFISYIALKGDSSFPKAPAHTKYAQGARSSANWKVLPAASTYPKVGDIIIKGRAGNTLNFTDAKYRGKSHGDLVTYLSVPDNAVERLGHKYHTLGGNVGHTVRKKFFTADSNGYYGNDMVLCLRPQAGVNIQAMVDAATREWKLWHVDTEEQDVDLEHTANRNGPRSPLIFERLKTYWASVNYTNFNKDTA